MTTSSENSGVGQTILDATGAFWDGLWTAVTHPRLHPEGLPLPIHVKAFAFGMNLLFGAAATSIDGNWFKGAYAFAMGALAAAAVVALLGAGAAPLVVGIAAGLVGWAVSEIAEGVYEWAETTGHDMAQAIGSAIGQFMADLPGILEEYYNQGISTAEQIFDAIVQEMVDVIEAVGELAEGVAEAIVEAISEGWLEAKAAAAAAGQAVQDYLGGLYNDALDGLGQLYGWAKNIFSPLVLDLNGDGVILTALEGSGAYFDLDADGFAQKTGWVAGGDGLLAIDKNGDGIINDITELLGVAEEYATATTNGFDTLATLDSNLDGKIDAGDALFGSLKVWIDADGDGFTDAGELKSLSELGIASISLNETKQESTNAGNIISDVSGFTKTDGTTGTIVDAWFQNSNVETVDIRPVWRVIRGGSDSPMEPEKVELMIYKQRRGGAITNEADRIAA